MIIITIRSTFQIMLLFSVSFPCICFAFHSHYHLIAAYYSTHCNSFHSLRCLYYFVFLCFLSAYKETNMENFLNLLLHFELHFERLRSLCLQHIFLIAFHSSRSLTGEALFIMSERYKTNLNYLSYLQEFCLQRNLFCLFDLFS